MLSLDKGISSLAPTSTYLSKRTNPHQHEDEGSTADDRTEAEAKHADKPSRDEHLEALSLGTSALDADVHNRAGRRAPRGGDS